MPSVASLPMPVAAPTAYADATDAWRGALDRYLQLARDGASSATLRAAIAAVHAAALERGRCAAPADVEH